MLNSLSTPVVIAHRGSSAYAPENTLASFLLAVEQGAEVIEMDVQLTADNQVAVFHDQTVDRTTDGSGKVSDLTLAELKSITTTKSHPQDHSNAAVPELGESLDAIDPAILVNIELKNLFFPFDRLPRETAEIIRQRDAGNRVYFSSFNPFALTRIGRLLPDAPRGRLLYFPFTVAFHALFPWLLKGCSTVNISMRSATKQRINSFQKAGLLVFIYTLNHPEDIIKALELGADGIFTDDPPLGLRVVHDWKKATRWGDPRIQ